jgi:hypothetical protein
MKKTFATIGITVFVIGIALFGTAYLALAQGENIINVCVAKDGSMRVVAGEEQCKSKETPLSWNKQGEPGPAGVLGFYTVTSEVEVPGISFGERTTARCDIGDSVTGGGSHYLSLPNRQEFGSIDLYLVLNRPAESEGALGEGWTVEVIPNLETTSTFILEVFAVCADLTP